MPYHREHFPLYIVAVHQNELISCHDCGRLHRQRPLQRRESAYCTRCAALLYRATPPDLTRMVALTLAALLIFLIAQCSPIVTLEVKGALTGTTLIGAIGVLWSEQMRLVASMVFFCTVVFPLLELGALLYVALGLRAGMRAPGTDWLLRGVQLARQWAMTEVLMIGILVTLVKMTALARVMPQPGLFAFGALTLMLALVVRFEPRTLWEVADRLRAPAAAPALTGVPLLCCAACARVTAAQPGVKRQRCPRCGSLLRRRRPNSVSNTWALLIAAAILYIPANLLTVLHSHTLLGGDANDTIMSGVVYFWRTGSHLLAVIIFVASIVVPLLKLAILSLLAVTAQRRSRWRPQQRTRLYRMVEFIGRWSMLDMFVVTLTVALVRFQTLAVITPGPGALAFTSVVLLTMLASMQFDPRLIWDPVPNLGEPHA